MSIGGSPSPSNPHTTVDRVCWKQYTTCTQQGVLQHRSDWGQWEPRCWLFRVVNPTDMTTDTNTEASNLLMSLLLLATPILAKLDSLDNTYDS